MLSDVKILFCIATVAQYRVLRPKAKTKMPCRDMSNMRLRPAGKWSPCHVEGIAVDGEVKIGIGFLVALCAIDVGPED